MEEKYALFNVIYFSTFFIMTSNVEKKFHAYILHMNQKFKILNYRTISMYFSCYYNNVIARLMPIHARQESVTRYLYSIGSSYFILDTCIQWH